MRSNAAATLLRWGLAFVFLYAAIASLRHPDVWAEYLPQFLTNLIPSNLLLTGFSVYELALTVWLFSGKKLVWAAMVSAVTLAGITLANPSILDITFHDIGLAMAALALFELARARDFKENEGAD